MVTAIGIHVADQLPEGRIIDFFAAVVERIKCAWKIEYSEVIHKRNLRGSVLDNERDVTIGARLKQIAVTAKRSIGVDLNFHASIA